MEKPPVWVVESWGVSVSRLEKLREDDLYIYARIHGQGGRGSRYWKLSCFDYRCEAFEYAAFLLEGVARDHREEAARSKHGKI